MKWCTSGKSTESYVRLWNFWTTYWTTGYRKASREWGSRVLRGPRENAQGLWFTSKRRGSLVREGIENRGDADPWLCVIYTSRVLLGSHRYLVHASIYVYIYTYTYCKDPRLTCSDPYTTGGRVAATSRLDLKSVVDREPPRP